MRARTHCPYCGGRIVRRALEGRTRRYCPACDLPIYDNPVPATCVVAFAPDGRLLLVKRAVAPKKGMWCLPGGFMELGESPEEAAARELAEETGLTGTIGPLLGVMAAPSQEYETVLMVGYGSLNPRGPLIPGDDADQCRWFSPTDLPPVAFSSHRAFIDIALTRFPHS